MCWAGFNGEYCENKKNDSDRCEDFNCQNEGHDLTSLKMTFISLPSSLKILNLKLIEVNQWALEQLLAPELYNPNTPFQHFPYLREVRSFNRRVQMSDWVHWGILRGQD